MSSQSRKSNNSQRVYLGRNNRGDVCYILASSQREAEQIYFNQYGYGMNHAFSFVVKPVEDLVLTEIE